MTGSSNHPRFLLLCYSFFTLLFCPYFHIFPTHYLCLVRVSWAV